MERLTRTPWARRIAKWSAFAAILLAPGSFIVLPVLWLIRQIAVARAR